MMETEEKILLAKHNKKAAEELLMDYIPFIRKEVSRMNTLGLEYDDMESIAMIAFLSSIQQYDKDKGGFFSLAKQNIQNRLIDEYRKQKRYRLQNLPYYIEETQHIEENRSAAFQYNIEQERAMLAEEIKEYSAKLEEFQITFEELTQICPKQDRTKRQCYTIAKEIFNDDALKTRFFQTQRIPQAEAAKRVFVSIKTIEKHRKYIAALIILLAGDFPGIQAFLPKSIRN